MNDWDPMISKIEEREETRLSKLDESSPVPYQNDSI
jgi:hypothetical protein